MFLSITLVGVREVAGAGKRLNLDAVVAVCGGAMRRLGAQEGDCDLHLLALLCRLARGPADDACDWRLLH